MKRIFLIAFAAALMLASCASHKSNGGNVKIDGEWIITNASGVAIHDGDNEAFINFDGKGNVNGNATVNLFFGSYSTSGNKLSFGTMGMTQMLGASMEMEDAITKALNSTASVSVEGDEATVYGSDGKTVMTLKRKK